MYKERLRCFFWWIVRKSVEKDRIVSVFNVNNIFKIYNGDRDLF